MSYILKKSRNYVYASILHGKRLQYILQFFWKYIIYIWEQIYQENIECNIILILLHLHAWNIAIFLTHIFLWDICPIYIYDTFFFFTPITNWDLHLFLSSILQEVRQHILKFMLLPYIWLGIFNVLIIFLTLDMVQSRCNLFAP